MGCAEVSAAYSKKDMSNYIRVIRMKNGKRRLVLSWMEGKSIWAPGLVIWPNVIDIRILGNAWIWNRGQGWYRRLKWGKGNDEPMYKIECEVCKDFWDKPEDMICSACEK